MASAAAINPDPAIVDFTWEQLLEYNKSSIRGEKKSIFLQNSPLLKQAPSDMLIKLHDLGVLIDNGQEAERIEEYDEKTQTYRAFERRAYLECFVTRDIADIVVKKTSTDPEILLEVTVIKGIDTLFESDSLSDMLDRYGKVTLTREKTAPSQKALATAKWNPQGKTYEWDTHYTYNILNLGFRNWNSWVQDELCHLFIMNKTYNPASTSITQRLLGYISDIYKMPRHFKRFYISQPNTKIKYENVSNSIENYDGVPICDPIGLRQHAGECWSDSIQQLLLYSDGIKDKSQPFFINNTKDTFTSHLKNVFDSKKIEDLVSLLMLIKKRFVHRYQSLKEFKNGEHGFECLLEDKNPMKRYEKFMSFFDTQSANKGKLKRTTSGFLGISSANLLKTIANGNNASAIINAGATYDVYLLAVSLLLQSIGIQFNIVNRYIYSSLIKKQYREDPSKLAEFVKTQAVTRTVIQANILDKFDTSNVNATMIYGSIKTILGLRYFDATYPIEKSKLHFMSGIEKISIGVAALVSKEYYEKQSKYLILPDGKDYAEIIMTSLTKDIYGHATCFYKCNSKLYYYDDNHGIFETPPGLDIDNINGIFLDIHKNIYFVDITYDSDITDLNLFHEGEMKSIKDENVQKILTNPEQPLIYFMKFNIYHHITVNEKVPAPIIPKMNGPNANNAKVPKMNDQNANNDIVDFTWQQLLEYNKAFLRGEKKSTFYHGAPLVSDQVPSDLIKLHDLGVFTFDGQATELEETYEQRAYLECLMPLAIAKKFISEARKDPEVIFEVSLIKADGQLYLSDEIRTAWETDPGYISMTRVKKTPETVEWDDYTTVSEPMLMLYVVKDMHFHHWDEWVRDGLCYIFITDKDFGQAPKSMAERVVAYLSAAGGRRRHTRKRKSRKPNRRNTRARR